MFCKNCGKEFPDSANFCDICGAKLEENTKTTEEAVSEEVKETAEVIPEAVEEKAEEAPANETPAPVAKAPKKKGLGKIIIAISAIVAVLGVTVFASFPYVKNFVEKTFSSPEKYYQNVEEESISELSSVVADVFDEIKKSGKTAEENLDAINDGKAVKSEFDGKKVSADLSLTLGNSLIELLSEASGMDLDAFKKIGISFDVEENDGLAALGAKLSLSDSKIISALITATEDAKLYAELPELSDTAIKMDIPKLLGFDSMKDIYSSPEYEEALEQSIKLVNALPDGETAEKIIARYADAVLAEIDSVDKYSDKISVGELEVNATCLEAEIDEKTLEKIALAAIREFEDDDELHDIIDAFMVAAGEAEKGEFKEYLEDTDIFDNAKDEIKGSFEGFGEIVIKTYVNAKGEVLGREIEYQDSTISLFYITKGKKSSFELGVEAEGFNANILGEGTLKKGIFNGEATLEMMSMDIAEIEFVDFDTENAFNGTLIIKPSKTISSMLSEYETDDLSSLLGMEIDSLGIDLAKLSLEISMENTEEKGAFAIDIKSGKSSIVKLETKFNITDAGKIKIPSNTVDANDETGLMRWAGTLNTEGFIKTLPEMLQSLIGELDFNESTNEPYYEEEDWETTLPEEPIYPENALFLATSADFQPFVYKDGNGNLTGIDIEIASALAIELGMVLYVDEMDFDSLIHSVADGDNHIAMSAITATDERLEVVDFSEYYICNTQVVLVREDSTIQYRSDLYENTYRIGVKEGTTAHFYATDDFGIDNVYYYETYDALLSGLTDGFVDLIILDYPYATKYAEEVAGVKRLAEDFSFEPYNIAVSKDNPELTTRINEAIITLRYNGVISEIYNRYINDTPVIPYVTVSVYEEEYDDTYEDVYYDNGYEYDYEYDYDYSADSIFDYEFDGGTTVFDNTFGMTEEDYGYSYKEEPVMDDYYYNDYYYSDRHTEDYFSDYGY